MIQFIFEILVDFVVAGVVLVVAGIAFISLVLSIYESLFSKSL